MFSLNGWLIKTVALAILGAFVGGTYSTGYYAGKNACSLDARTKENAALVEASNRIATTFYEYERILSEIDAEGGGDSVPPLVRSTIDRLPNPAKR